MPHAVPHEADRLAVGREAAVVAEHGRLGRQNSVTSVTSVTYPCFQWLTSDARLAPSVTASVTSVTLALAAAVGDAR